MVSSKHETSVLQTTLIVILLLVYVLINSFTGFRNAIILVTGGCVLFNNHLSRILLYHLDYEKSGAYPRGGLDSSPIMWQELKIIIIIQIFIVYECREQHLIF